MIASRRSIQAPSGAKCRGAVGGLHGLKCSGNGLIVGNAANQSLCLREACGNSLGVAPTVLTDRLETLCASGVLERYQPRMEVDRHAYRMTDAGRALFPIVVAFMQWGDEWISGAGNEPVRLSDKRSGRPIAAVLVTNEEGKPLIPSEVVFAAGNGADADTLAAFARASA